jgi:hypothetical protein
MNSTKLQPDWWVRVPEAERRFLRVLMGTIHEVEEQGPPEVARAGVGAEPGIALRLR